MDILLYIDYGDHYRCSVVNKSGLRREIIEFLYIAYLISSNIVENC